MVDEPRSRVPYRSPLGAEVFNPAGGASELRTPGALVRIILALGFPA
jgi:hypothetical protein